MNKLQSLTLALCTSLTLAASGSALAHSDHGTASLIKERKQGFKVMGKSMRAMGKMMKSGNTDIAEVSKRVDAIKTQSLKISDWFAVESSNESHKTDALPAIWTEKAEFAKKAKALQTAATEVQDMLKKDDFQLKAAMMKLKKTCGSCHKQFKAD